MRRTLEVVVGDLISVRITKRNHRRELEVIETKESELEGEVVRLLGVDNTATLKIASFGIKLVKTIQSSRISPRWKEIMTGTLDYVNKYISKYAPVKKEIKRLERKHTETREFVKVEIIDSTR